ncbi:MAG: hypothetical protein OXI66_16405 [Boseongicola sp.]|nr:hypothetical protein [Boseongicola sp.]
MFKPFLGAEPDAALRVRCTERRSSLETAVIRLDTNVAFDLHCDPMEARNLIRGMPGKRGF